MLFFYRNLKIMEPTEKRKLEAMRSMYDKNKNVFIYPVPKPIFFHFYMWLSHLLERESLLELHHAIESI